MPTYIVMDAGTAILITPFKDHAEEMAVKRRDAYKPEFQHHVALLEAEVIPIPVAA